MKIVIEQTIIENIIKYCEDQAIFDKLGNYGDFYYKLKKTQYFKVETVVRPSSGITSYDTMEFQTKEEAIEFINGFNDAPVNELIIHSFARPKNFTI